MRLSGALRGISEDIHVMRRLLLQKRPRCDIVEGEAWQETTRIRQENADRFLGMAGRHPTPDYIVGQRCQLSELAKQKANFLPHNLQECQLSDLRFQALRADFRDVFPEDPSEVV